MHNAAQHKIDSQTNYNHLGRSTLLRWDILWIGFTLADSWWADKVTGCTSSHLKQRHESRTGVSWVYQSCQSINDNYWARTPVGCERGNENDHGGNNTGNGTNYGDWKIITKTEWYYQPTHADRSLPSMCKVCQLGTMTGIWTLFLLIKPQKKKTYNDLLEFP